MSVPRIVHDHDRLLTPGEVAADFRVSKRTVTRWARGGKLSLIRTLGGQVRLLESEVVALLAASTDEAGVL